LANLRHRAEIFTRDLAKRHLAGQDGGVLICILIGLALSALRPAFCFFHPLRFGVLVLVLSACAGPNLPDLPSPVASDAPFPKLQPVPTMLDSPATPLSGDDIDARLRARAAALRARAAQLRAQNGG